MTEFIDYGAPGEEKRLIRELEADIKRLEKENAKLERQVKKLSLVMDST